MLADHLQKTKKKFKNIKKHIYKNELDKACFQHDMEKCIIKQVHQKNVIFVTIGILKILVLIGMSHIFAMVVMI